MLAAIEGDLNNGLVVVADGLGLALDVRDNGFDGLVDAALQRHGIRAGGEGLEPLLEDGLGQDGGRGGAVTGGVGGLGGGFLHGLGSPMFS